MRVTHTSVSDDCLHYCGKTAPSTREPPSVSTRCPKMPSPSLFVVGERRVTDRQATARRCYFWRMEVVARIVGVRAGRTHNRIRRGTVSSRPSPRHVRDVLARRRGESPPRRDPRARARRARRARLPRERRVLGQRELPDRRRVRRRRRLPGWFVRARRPSAIPTAHPLPPPPIRHPRRAVRRRPVGAIHASRFERESKPSSPPLPTSSLPPGP